MTETRVSKAMKSVSDLPTKDRLRILQCLFCLCDPAICDCDETDEDEDGLCKKYQGTIVFKPQESDHTCKTCKHYTSGERDGSCGSYICKGYSNWESEDGVCKDCYYNDGEVHAECVICDKAESEGTK